MFTFSFFLAFGTRGGACSVGWRAWLLVAVTLVAGLGGPASAQVIIYEGNVFPETLGWQRLPFGPPLGKRSIEQGCFIQTVQGNEENSSFRMTLHPFVGVNQFFVEWRAVTDNPSWLIDQWQIPAVVAAGGRAASLYHTVMTEPAAVLLRDVIIPRVIAPISVGESHTYRIEVFSDEYIWFVDGTVADSGVPEGPYPDADAVLIWGVEGNDGVTATTAWDFVRAGRIPVDASGDYDNDTAVTLIDLYFFDDCLTKDGPGIFGGPDNDAGPGCRFADFDADGDVDLRDFAAFQNIFSG